MLYCQGVCVSKYVCQWLAWYECNHMCSIIRKNDYRTDENISGYQNLGKRIITRISPATFQHMIWYDMIYDIRSMMYNTWQWYMMYDIWHVMGDMWCITYDAWYVIYDIWHYIMWYMNHMCICVLSILRMILYIELYRTTTIYHSLV